MATSRKAKIGVRDVAAMGPHSLIWDQEVKGFCARRQFDVITYSVVYRSREGQQHWLKLGRHPILTPPHLARLEAIRVLREVTLGNDPSRERYELRHGMTVSELCEEYSQKVNGKKPATIRSDNSRIKMHIKPKLGKYKVASVTSEHVENFMHSLSQAHSWNASG
jgi:Phage integrase, N-terminal SAM-like domain